MLCLFVSSTHLIASAERRGGAETESVESGRLSGGAFTHPRRRTESPSKALHRWAQHVYLLNRCLGADGKISRGHILLEHRVRGFSERVGGCAAQPCRSVALGRGQS